LITIPNALQEKLEEKQILRVNGNIQFLWEQLLGCKSGSPIWVALFVCPGSCDAFCGKQFLPHSLDSLGDWKIWAASCLFAAITFASVYLAFDMSATTAYLPTDVCNNCLSANRVISDQKQHQVYLRDLCLYYFNRGEGPHWEEVCSKAWTLCT